MTKPTDAELLAEWDRVSHIADAGQRRLACLRAVLDKWGQPAPRGAPVAWLNPWRADQVTTDYDAYGEHGIPLYTAPQPSPAAQGYALDAGRWRRLVNASELSFPVATIADDPENGAVMLYGRKALEDFVDRMDEIPNTYDAARAAQEGKSHDN